MGAGATPASLYPRLSVVLLLQPGLAGGPGNRTESAFEDAAVEDEGTQSGFNGLRIETEAGSRFASGEGAVGAGVAADELENGRVDGLEKRPGEAWRERNFEGVAIAGRVLDGDVALPASDFDGQDAAGVDEFVHGPEQFGRGDALGDFVAGERAKPEQEVVDSVAVASALGFAEELELAFDFGNGDGVEELAQVGFAEEVGELRLIDGESGSAAFGEGRVAVVDEIADVSEQQRSRKG